MGLDNEPESEDPAPPTDRPEGQESRTTHPTGHDGLPLPELHAYRDGFWIVACCPACGGAHIYRLDDPRDPVGAADRFVRGPCDEIQAIGGAFVVERAGV